MDDISLSDWLIIIKQKKVTFLLTFGLIFAASILGSLFWSNYRSTATIAIEQPQVSTDRTTPAGMNAGDSPEALADLRVNKIQQRVTSPSSLVDIITKLNLYPQARSHESLAGTAERMANKIKLNFINSVVANPAAAQKVSADQLSAIAFTLSYDDSDPQTAQAVTNELATRFLDEDLKDRRDQVDATSNFIQEQITTLENAMVEQEKKIADFEAANGASRPETLMFNQQAAANAALSLQTLDSQITANEGTQGSLRSQLAGIDPYSRVVADGQVLTTPAIQLKALQAQYTTLTAQYGPDHPDVVKVRHQIEALRTATGGRGIDTSTLKAKIEDVKTNLDAARKNYGPDNPDVVALKRQLDGLQTQLSQADSSNGAAKNLRQDADNPAYLELVAQLNSTEEQHKSLLAQRDKLTEQQEKYQKAILQNPALQQQMAALSRDYDNAQLRYRELKEKKMAADMDKKMIEEHHGQHLTMISPPRVPTSTQPPRILIVMAGFLFAVLGGFTAILIGQMTSRSISGPRQVEILLGVPPLICIPHITTEQERSQSSYQKSQTLLNNLIARHMSAFNSSVD